MNLYRNNFGENTENMKYFGEGMKYLPNSLQILTINLCYNNLGGNFESMIWLKESMK